MQQAAVGGLDHDALVDLLQQVVVAHLGFAAAAEVARHRHHAAPSVVVEAGRMHFDREPRAVGAHVADFDHVGLAAVERFQHRPHVLLGKVRVEHVDRLADDLVPRPPVGRHPGPVEVEHGAVGGDHADRVGHRVEQRVVAGLCVPGIGAGRAQRVGGLPQQVAGVRRQRGVARRRLQFRRHRAAAVTRRLRHRIRRRPVHALALARVTRLPVARPRMPDSHAPVSTRASRSTPVATPSPCSM